MSFYIQLPENPTTNQIETYNKNCELFKLAMINRNRYGVLMSLCADLGSQDAIFWDSNRFINVYPYSYFWYKLAYGYKYNNNEPDIIIH
jgi:hypothetical protein